MHLTKEEIKEQYKISKAQNPNLRPEKVQVKGTRQERKVIDEPSSKE